MSEKIPMDRASLNELMRRPIIVRIVTILDITSLSILELFEYGLTLKDINYSMANGVIGYDKPKKAVRQRRNNCTWNSFNRRLLFQLPK
jgi:hypothetical protein